MAGWTGQAAKGAADQFSVKALEEFLSGWMEPLEDAILSPKKTWEVAVKATSAFVTSYPHAAAAIGVGSVLSLLLARYAYKHSWYNRTKTAVGNVFKACVDRFDPEISAKVGFLGVAFGAFIKPQYSVNREQVEIATGRAAMEQNQRVLNVLGGGRGELLNGEEVLENLRRGHRRNPSS